MSTPLPGLDLVFRALEFTADKICNVRDVAHAPPANWNLERRREYLLWTEQVVAGCRGVNAALEACYDEALREGRRTLGLDE